MPTRAKRSGAALLCALALAGCGLAEERAESQQADSKAAPVPKNDKREAGTKTLLAKAGDADCLLLIWEKQQNPDRDFDRRFDAATGGAISCATGTTASEFERAIADIRKAALSRDRKAMMEQVRLPLLYIDADGNRRELADASALDVLFNTVFDSEVLDALAEIDLQEMSVTAGQGGDFHLGSVWLAVEQEAGPPRIVTINHQALAEAMQLAAAEAAASPAASPATRATGG
ncbi:hypothetical protein VCJ71_00920 [Alteriqipengyuania sp. WL0013]|uniref:hypothetical protein n=1 Tax=Alteriqipengyuania sp. WL0013 TaxID=3110773 RepID=UPI002C33E3C1|nr:hypothetical protein [Alteriqipengyuania sp. WL0013]MEB3414618.1 hypothetical protein [Alteriqipengyuania sp. WL0013]